MIRNRIVSRAAAEARWFSQQPGAQRCTPRPTSRLIKIIPMLRSKSKMMKNDVAAGPWQVANCPNETVRREPRNAWRSGQPRCELQYQEKEGRVAKLFEDSPHRAGGQPTGKVPRSSTQLFCAFAGSAWAQLGTAPPTPHRQNHAMARRIGVSGPRLALAP